MPWSASVSLAPDHFYLSVWTEALHQYSSVGVPAALHLYQFTILSFISATKSIKQFGISAGDMGRHMNSSWDQPLNRESATASPVNHNEATSGSVEELHLRRVSV